MMQAAGGMGGQGGGIISSALQLIKEKERQGDRATKLWIDFMMA